MSERTGQEKLRNFFSGKNQLTVEDLAEYFRLDKPSRPMTAIRWRIHELKRDGVIRSIGKGLYTLDLRNTFQPELSKSQKILFNRIHNEFPYLALCIWSTQWLSRWMVHQPSVFLTIVEAEAEGEDSVLTFLQRRGATVFRETELKDPSKYLPPNEEIFVVKRLLSQSPISEVDDFPMPKIEKILVDLIADREVFFAFQGEELRNIFENTRNEFNLNIATLRRYADRRGKREALERYLPHTFEARL